MTHRQLIEEAKARLVEAGIEEASNDAWMLFSEAFSMDRTAYLLHMNDEAGEATATEYKAMVSQRYEHIPLQYITGRTWFMGNEFHVDANVLIPRFDTEILVEKAYECIDEQAKVLDMCTGSGCIAISIALQYPRAHVIAVDVSMEALSVAKKNADRLAAQNVEFVRSDMFTAVSGKYDVIISNPPYIATKEIASLTKEVADNEPMLALDGHEDGLFFYKILTEEGREFLKDNGLLLMEIGYDQADAVSTMLKNNGFTDVSVIRDLAGLDRVVCGRRK